MVDHSLHTAAEPILARQTPELATERSARLAAEQTTQRLQATIAALAGARVPQDVAAVIIQQGLHDLGICLGLVVLLTSDGTAVDVMSSIGFGHVPGWSGHGPLPRLAIDSGFFVVEVVRTGQPVWLGSLTAIATAHPERARLLADWGVGSMVCLPLIIDGRTIGCMGLGYSEPQAFDAPERLFLQALAAQCAQAMDRAQVYHDAQTHAARLQALSEASAVLTRAGLDTPLIIEALCGLAMVHVGDGCAVRLLSGDRRTLTWAVARNRDPEIQAFVEALMCTGEPAEVGLSGGILAGSESVFLPVVSAVHLDFLAHGRLRTMVDRYPFHSLISVPVRSSGQIFGLLTVTRYVADQSYTEADRQFCQELADRAGMALENARLFHAERAAHALTEEALRRTGMLQRLTASLSMAVTSGEIGQVLVHEGSRAFGAHSSLLMLVSADGDALELLSAVGIDTGLSALWGRLPMAQAGAFADVVRSRVPLFADEHAAWLAVAPVLPGTKELPPGPRYVLPLLVGEQALGILGFAFAEGRALAPDERQLLLSIAEQGALALHRAWLFAAEKLARRLAEAPEEKARLAVLVRDDFLSIASHELKTPLTSLDLQQEVLFRAAHRDPALAPYRERLDMGRRQIRRLTRLVHDLLDVSRLSAGPLVLAHEDLDLAAVVGEVAGRFAEDLDRAGSPLTLALSAARGAWDRGRLDQVVTNLLANAVKYGNGQPIAVTLRVADGLVSLAVRDGGIGIDPAQQSRLFQRFERLVSTQHYGGFGLGLWITRQIVEAMGGTIGVVSRLGEGATFTVGLPWASRLRHGADLAP
ncbi:MAG: GAF domain-containing protein [Candidatus Sericytochromatia bacterium]|nr:GAF domain-containing protein [Candidatus Sericytochromatia bacterium]